MRSLLVFDPSVLPGMVFILWAAWRWFAVPRDARRSEYLLLLGVFALIVDPAAQAVADSLSHVRPMKMDLYAYALDGYLGQPAFVMGRMVAPHAWAKALLNVLYGLLPMVVILVLTWHILRRGGQRAGDVSRMVWAFVLNLVLAPVFYLVLPVSGPRFAFPAFPANPGVMVPHMMRLHAAPNGVPSVHMSTALLVMWFCRRSRVGLWLAGVYLVLMIVATLASGQHYGVDLVAAIPYTAAVLGLSRLPWFGAAEAKALGDGTAER